MNATILVSIVSMAPMPSVLPDYDLICRAGSMESIEVVQMTVNVHRHEDQRVGRVRTQGGSYQASVASSAITLFESIGGRGFIDRLEYETDGKRSEIIINVRGEIEDNLIGFQVNANSRGFFIRGSCHLSSAMHLQGAIQ